MDPVDHEPGRVEQQSDLAGREAGGPEVELALLAGVVAHRRPLVQHPGPGVELLFLLQEPQREVGGEGREREPTPRPDRGAEPGDDPGVVVAAEEPEPALTDTDHRVERLLERELADVEHLEPGRQAFGGGRLGRERDEVGRQIDPGDLDPPSGEFQRVPPRPAPRVEHLHPRYESELAHEEVDLLAGPLGEQP